MENVQRPSQQRKKGTPIKNTNFTFFTMKLCTMSLVICLIKMYCVQVFEASLDGHSMALNSLFPPITARFLQIWPQGWHGRMFVQVQVLGCPLSGYRPRSNPGGEAPSHYWLLAFAVCSFFIRLYINELKWSFFLLLMSYNEHNITKVIRPRYFKADFSQSL